MAHGLSTARLKLYVPMIEKETRDFLTSWGESVRAKTNDLDAAVPLHRSPLFQAVPPLPVRHFFGLVAAVRPFVVVRAVHHRIIQF